MLTKVWTIFLGLVAVVAAVAYFLLDRKIKEEDRENKVEPDLNELFNELASAESESANTKVAGNSNFSSSTIGKESSIKSNFSVEDDVNSEISEPKDKTITSTFSSVDEHTPSMNDDDLLADDSTKDDSQKMFSKGVFEQMNIPFVDKIKGLFSPNPAGEKSKIFEDEAPMELSISDYNEQKRPMPIERIALILKAPTEQPYTMREILEVANELQLVIGRHRYIDHLTMTFNGEEPMYSIAHLLHPGTFDEEFIMEDLDREIPGLLFFSDIPGPDPEMDTVDYLIKAAAQFGNALGGFLYDDKGNHLDKEGLSALYEKYSEIEQEEWNKILSKSY